jgi:hypothetical protein
MAIQAVEVRFEGEEIARHTDRAGVNTLYRTPEDLYRIHIDEGPGLAFVESGLHGDGLTEAQVRSLWPELAEAAGL